MASPKLTETPESVTNQKISDWAAEQAELNPGANLTRPNRPIAWGWWLAMGATFMLWLLAVVLMAAYRIG